MPSVGREPFISLDVVLMRKYYHGKKKMNMYE